MEDYLTLNNAAKATTLLIATTGTIVGLRSFISPLATAQSFGLPQSQNPSAFDPLIPVVGGRNLASGLAIYALAYQRNWKALGATMCCGVVTAVTDAIVCYRYGARDAAVGHGVAGLLIMSLGLWFSFGAGR